MEGIELPNQERIRMHREKENYNDNIGSGLHQKSGNERKKIRKEYLRYIRKLLKTNLIKEIKR